MKLSAWLAEKNMSGAEFADKVGVNRSTVGRWLDGTGKPGWDQLSKIRDLTKSAVTANDFMDEEVQREPADAQPAPHKDEAA